MKEASEYEFRTFTSRPATARPSDDDLSADDDEMLCALASDGLWTDSERAAAFGTAVHAYLEMTVSGLDAGQVFSAPLRSAASMPARYSAHLFSPGRKADLPERIWKNLLTTSSLPGSIRTFPVSRCALNTASSRGMSQNRQYGKAWSIFWWIWVMSCWSLTTRATDQGAERNTRGRS